MTDLIFGDDDFDLDQLLNDPGFLNDLNSLNDFPGHVSDPDPNPDPQQKFVEIEELLMNDEFDDESNCNELVFDVLLESPVESDTSRCEVLNGFDSKVNSPEGESCDKVLNGFDSKVNSPGESCDKALNGFDSKVNSPEGESCDKVINKVLNGFDSKVNSPEGESCDKVINGFDSKVNSPEGENCDKESGEEVTLKRGKDSEDGEDPDEDPLTKKRKRQERNRDAAVRSRERKKLYVKELEMKSRYFEGECKRLGMLLNCVVAENQALRLSLHSSKAFDASMTKQESAVLLLESLLLGSLLWFLGTMCLLILPDPLRLTKEEAPPENVDNQNRGSLAPRKAGKKIAEHGGHQSFMLSKSCKASRSRMRTSDFVLEVFA